MSKYPHTNKREFIEAVRKTAGDTGFSEALIEKDYFCSIVLKEIFSTDAHGLVFKGGTLLNKTHAGFYRLSEDLDFSINSAPDLNRKKRSELAQPAKEHLLIVAKSLALHFTKEIRGGNENSQYNGEIEYDSLVLGGKGQIKIEIGIREPVLERKKLMARTLVKGAFSQESLVQDFEILGLSLEEAYAEKLRAAISRKHPAIRDIFDIEYALNKKLIDIIKIKPYVQQKFEIQKRVVNLTEERKKIFKEQLVSNLRPVLRESDYKSFDFEKSWENLLSLSQQLFK